MTNLVLLSIQLVTNDVSSYQIDWRPFIESNGANMAKVTTNVWKKEVWQLYTIGYQTPFDVYGNTLWTNNNGKGNWIQVLHPISIFSTSNKIGTLEPKQETNWVFTPAKP